MVKAVHRLLIVLIALAVVGGAANQLARAAQCAAAVAAMPCAMMADAGPGGASVACKGMTSDCISHMGCMTEVALPARMISLQSPGLSNRVDYWAVWTTLAGLTRNPEPVPPRTA